MRNLFISILLILFLHISKAQNYHQIDSLKQELSRVKDDTNKVNIYSDLGYAYQWSSPDTALSYAVPGLTLAKKLHFETGELNVFIPICEALSMKGNYSKALEFQFQALELAKKINDPQKIANAMALIGGTYYYAKDYQKALIYYYKAQEIHSVFLGSPEIIMGFIGEAYFYLNQLDSSLLYIQKAYEQDINSTTFHWSTPYFFLAAIHEKKGNIAKAIFLFFYNSPAGAHKIRDSS